MFIGHQEHTGALCPESTGCEGLAIFFFIVQHIADQPLLGLNATRCPAIGSHFQLHASFFKVRGGFAIGLVPEPAFFYHRADCTFTCGDTPGLVDLAQRFTHRFLSANENFLLGLVLPLLHHTS